MAYIIGFILLLLVAILGAVMGIYEVGRYME